MHTTARYLLRRIGGAIVTLVAVSIVAFVITRVVPGNPGVAILGDRATPEVVARFNHDFGLDKPLVAQYWSWLTGFLHGDFGHSLSSTGTGGGVSDISVASIVSQGLTVTAPLSLFGMLIAVVLGVTMGVLSAARNGRFTDHAVSTVSLAGISSPDFFIAFVLLLVFAVKLRWLPSVGFTDFSTDPGQWLRSLILPAVSIGLINSAALARVSRGSIIDALGSEYAFIARSKGAPGRVVVLKHALRSSIMPIATLAGLQTGYLLGGVVVIENVFALPGMGRSLLLAVQERDYPTIQALIMVFAAAFILINLLVDLAYPLLDPRMK